MIKLIISIIDNKKQIKLKAFIKQSTLIKSTIKSQHLLEKDVCASISSSTQLSNSTKECVTLPDEQIIL
ncbi:MAG: hypothetical protein ACK48W_03580 [Bacteroidota bacterium]